MPLRHAARVPAFSLPLQSAHQRGRQTQRALRRRYTVSPIRRFRGFGHSEKRLSARCLRLVPVALHVMFCRFRGVMRRMMQVALRGVRVVCRYFVIALFVMSRRFAVVTRRVFVMFRCLLMMLCRLLRHCSSSFHCVAGLPGRRKGAPCSMNESSANDERRNTPEEEIGNMRRR
jgi:hypothetical protein